MTPAETEALESALDQIVLVARDFGLDFFEMRYEICPSDIIYTFGAYLMPIRFSHWTFGKAYHRLKMGHNHGVSRIYELVINSDPCYAFLLDTNTLLHNKVIAAHVLAHSDFFKNNWRFQTTNRQMLWAMAAFAERVRHYSRDFGRLRVEKFLDAVLALQDQIDPYNASPETGTAVAGSSDLLWFLMQHAAELEDWQRDVLSSIRAEALYFRPQMETKILNEGWAATWHARILQEIDLSPDEAVEFARMHAGVLAPNRFHLNPYQIGFEIFADVERRFGRDKTFEIREMETDVSFIRNYLTEELVERLDLYLYHKVQDRWEVSRDRRDWEKVRDGIVALHVNCGVPCIWAEDADYSRRGELFLRHHYEGVELDAEYVMRTLPHVQTIWGRPVHLETVEADRAVCYSAQGGGVDRHILTAESRR